MVLLAELVESPVSELRVVIGDGVRDPESSDNVVEEFDRSTSADGGHRFGLDPLGELVDSDEEVGEALGRFLERPEDVEPPDRKGLRIVWSF